MTQPSRFPSTDRPDLSDRLLAAVAERDQAMAQRLVQQWVHRRGLVTLDALIAGPLCACQGVEAVEWLQLQAGLASNSEISQEIGVSVVQPEVRPSVQPVVQRAVLALVQDALAPAPFNAAPAPHTHSSLRAWLPDADGLAGHDLPLAS